MAILYFFKFIVILNYSLCLISGETTTVVQSECSYTFLVSRQENNSCPAISLASGSSNGETEYLKSIIKNQQDQLSMHSQNDLRQEQQIQSLTKSLQQLQEEFEAMKEIKQSGSNNSIRIMSGGAEQHALRQLLSCMKVGHNFKTNPITLLTNLNIIRFLGSVFLILTADTR